MEKVEYALIVGALGWMGYEIYKNYYHSASPFVPIVQVAQVPVNQNNSIVPTNIIATPVTGNVTNFVTPVTNIARPSIIAPQTALARQYGLPDWVTMGSSTGTPIGTYSLQAVGWVPIELVDPFTERTLGLQFGKLTWDQFINR